VWTRFDRAVGELNRAITGSNAAEVADAFGEIAETARILADAVETEERRQPDPAAISLRARGVA